MNDPFTNEAGLDYNSNDLGDMVDWEYCNSRDLPDSFFSEFIPASIATDNDSFIPKERMMVGDKYCSLIEEISYPENPEDDTTIVVGPREVDEWDVYIIPDFFPAMVSLKWYMDGMFNGEYMPLPYIPVAKPTIPSRLYYGVPQANSIDTFFSDRGGLIYAPFYEFTEKQPSEKYVVGDLEDEVVRQINLKMQKFGYKFIFSPKYEFFKSVKDLNYKLIWFEFNPFHPLSPRIVIDYDDNEGVVYGHYRWGRKVRPFYFDRNDRKYRIHSDVWGALFPQAHRFMAVFDLVGNYDFLVDLPQFVLTPRTFFRQEGPVGEVFSIDPQSHALPYSPMICERVSTSNRVYTYTSSFFVETDFRTYTQYVDITPYCDTCVVSGEKYDVRVYLRSSSRTIARLICKGNDFKVDTDFFVMYTLRGHFSVFVEDVVAERLKIDGIKYPKILVEGVMFSNFPRNSKGSLIPPLGVVNYHQFFREVRMFNVKFLETHPSVPSSLVEEIDYDDSKVPDMSEDIAADPSENKVQRMRKEAQERERRLQEDLVEELNAQASELALATRPERVTVGVNLQSIVSQIEGSMYKNPRSKKNRDKNKNGNPKFRKKK